jgi:hypothetical protein
MANLASRYVALFKEANYGQTPAIPVYIYGEIDEESMSQDFELIDRADITRYGKRKTVVGTYRASGDVGCALQGDEFCGRLIGAVFGSNAQTGSGPYVNTLSETSDEANYPSFNVVVGRDGREHRFLGQTIDSVSLGANINEYVMLSASFTGAGEDNSAEHALAAPTASDLHTADAFHFKNAYVNFSSKKVGTNWSDKIKSVEIEFMLNRDMDNAYALGHTTTVRAPPPQMREITGSIEFNQVLNSGDIEGSEPFYDQLSDGLLVDGSAANPALSLRFEGATGEFLELNIYKIQFEQPSSNVSGRDTQTLSVGFYALFDETEGAMSDAIWSTNDSTDILS